jgi:hypothetical protein
LLYLQNHVISETTIEKIKSRRMRWAGHVTQMGIKGMHIGLWWGKPEGKIPAGRPRCRWDSNIKINLKRNRIEWCGLGFI